MQSLHKNLIFEGGNRCKLEVKGAGMESLFIVFEVEIMEFKS